MSFVTNIRTQFIERYKKEPLLVIAPGRINLIGEHTDYNEGFVMPAAVDREIIFAVASNSTNQFNFHSIDYNETFSFRSDELKAGSQWFNYLMGVVIGFLQRGLQLSGVDCVFGGNIPTGAGMSSSAALCSGFGFALNKIFTSNLSRLDLARIGQQAEHEFTGVRCGIMDQYASLFGQKDSALLLDCRSLTHEYVPVNFPGVQILLVDTKVKHALASSAYNDRRAACEEGVRQLQKLNSSIQSLRDVSADNLASLQQLVDTNVYTKCKFVVEEIDRTQRAATFLRLNDVKEFGKLMFETHWGLSKAYEVSCRESDLIVTLAEEVPEEVFGARQMGGGFGGCIIHLIRNEAVEKYSLKVREKYVATFKKEPDFYSIDLCEGVHIVKPVT
ncbi:MAG: galactokinase [Cyclobacteriaceae bacterium]|nr:galactokinase [Cyclobacteriaceae bacterium]